MFNDGFLFLLGKIGDYSTNHNQRTIFHLQFSTSHLENYAFIRRPSLQVQRRISNFSYYIRGRLVYTVKIIESSKLLNNFHESIQGKIKKKKLQLTSQYIHFGFKVHKIGDPMYTNTS